MDNPQHSLGDALVVEWARETLADARAGRFDLRDLGKAMNGKWDQDFPAAVLAYIVRAALEAAGVAELREEIERLRTHISEHTTHAEQRIRDGKELGATVWRIGLEEIALECRSALTNQGKAQG